MDRFALRTFAAALACCFALEAKAEAATIAVPADFATIQAGIDAAADGDTITVAPGLYVENVDFLGKAVHVVGAGAETVIRGTGGSVVRFDTGEGNDSILDSVMVTGGNATQGGGIRILGASPTVVRTIVWNNRATSSGSGIYVSGGSEALLYNNLIAYNSNAGGDPHGIQIANSSPYVVNNTVARVDSNGLHTSGATSALVLNNIFARNGSPGRGRGICDFSGGATGIYYNVFFRNRISAFLRNGRDWKTARLIQRDRPDDGALGENVDGKPKFVGRTRRKVDKASPAEFALATVAKRQRAVDAGDPSPACNDLDGSRNDIGFTGGPYAAPSTALPGPGGCGLE